MSTGASSARKAASAGAYAVPVRHRSSQAQQPNRSAQTTEATSVTPRPRQALAPQRDRSGSPPVVAEQRRGVPALGEQDVQRLTVVR